MYYACFYAAIALLLSRGIETKSHEGVQRMLGLHFIKPGLIGKFVKIKRDLVIQIKSITFVGIKI
ncbi:MAG: hypothetical protein LUD17_11825 [Bacteroidales bacterium]|nr:hypothetical protein [Bacteroidales bacterium]